MLLEFGVAPSTLLNIHRAHLREADILILRNIRKLELGLVQLEFIEAFRAAQVSNVLCLDIFPSAT